MRRKEPPSDGGAAEGGGEPRKKARTGGGGAAPSVAQIRDDPLTKLCVWFQQGGGGDGAAAPPAVAFDAALVEKIYDEELAPRASGGAPDLGRLQFLEFSGYLQSYLWPHVRAVIVDTADATAAADAATAAAPPPLSSAQFAHVMSIILMVNEKFREGSLDPWEALFGGKAGDNDDEESAALFAGFFGAVVRLHDASAAEAGGAAAAGGGSAARAMTMAERTSYTLFLIHCFHSLECRPVRACALRLLSLPLWEVRRGVLTRGAETTAARR